MGQAVTVIIPTLATSERGPFLMRAIESALSQQKVRGLPVVVANGPRCCRELSACLKRRKDIRFVYLEEAGMPWAILAGRALVDTATFTEIDDDDLFLPHALISRLAALAANDTVDAVISNGFLMKDGESVISHPDITACQADPLNAILERLWLHPGAALFRTDTITADFFTEMPQYLEWTYLALRLSMERQLAFIDNPSFVHYLGLPFSLWQSEAAALGLPCALERILSLELPDPLRQKYEKAWVQAGYSISRRCLEEGQCSLAWNWQAKCLKKKFSIRQVPYTCYLLWRLIFTATAAACDRIIDESRLK